MDYKMKEKFEGYMRDLAEKIIFDSNATIEERTLSNITASTELILNEFIWPQLIDAELSGRIMENNDWIKKLLIQDEDAEINCYSNITKFDFSNRIKELNDIKNGKKLSTD